ncbi:MAG: DUF1801 domain-containing protein [Proteobacteria bacterium]|nr:DUF1801 domain-containing protein [Pseudomonadota bacterium]
MPRAGKGGEHDVAAFNSASMAGVDPMTQPRRTARPESRSTDSLRADAGQHAVDSALAGMDRAVAVRLGEVRDLVLATAAATPGVGPIEQALKWGQPSFLTTETGSGSTIRMDAAKSRPGGYAVYFHCQTNLVETFRGLYPDVFHFEGNRALHLNAADPLPAEELRHCLALALTYHQRKAGKR